MCVQAAGAASGGYGDGGSGWEALLRIGSAIAAEARAAVRAEAGFRTSAGIACNKMLSKLCRCENLSLAVRRLGCFWCSLLARRRAAFGPAPGWPQATPPNTAFATPSTLLPTRPPPPHTHSGLHKPDDQTVMPPAEAAAFVAPLPVRALPGVGEPPRRRGQAAGGVVGRTVRSRSCPACLEACVVPQRALPLPPRVNLCFLCCPAMACQGTSWRLSSREWASPQPCS